MRNRLRRLRFGEREYVWRAGIGYVVGDGGDDHRCIRVRVWGAGKNSRMLVADLLSTALSVGWTPAATDGAYPGAGDVRRLITHALGHGWDPDAVGGTFVIDEGSGLELPGFLITDRGRDPAAADPTDRVLRARGIDRAGPDA